MPLHLVKIRHIGTISEAGSGSKGRKTKVFLGTASAFGSGRELDSELFRPNVRRILGDTGKYKGKECSVRYEQHHR